MNVTNPKTDLVLCALAGAFLVLAVNACSDGGDGSATPAPVTTPKVIRFTPKEPEPLAIFWMDSGGNIGIRGVEAVVPGAPLPESDPRSGKITAACRKSATANGEGTLTVCMASSVGKILATELGFDTWTSETSDKK